MKVIYSFKQFKKHYKPLNSAFFRLAKYSVECSSKWYRTKLYSDSSSREIFNSYGIYFDEYEILESIETYSGNSYCIPKIYSMISESSPYIHLDFDAIIYENLVLQNSITYGNTEVDLTYRANTDAINYVQEQYIKPYTAYLQGLFEKEVDIEWGEIPNHSLIAVKNPELVSSVYKNILNKVGKSKIEKVTPMLIEQFLLYRYLKKNEVDIGYIHKNSIHKVEEKIIGSYKFYHFQKYNTDSPDANHINIFLDQYYKNNSKLF